MSIRRAAILAMIMAAIMQASSGGEVMHAPRDPDTAVTRAVYLGVSGYGESGTDKAHMDEFTYMFEIGGSAVPLKVINGTDENGRLLYPLQNTLKRGYAYEIAVRDDTVTAVRELPWDRPEFSPRVSGVPGERTVKNFLKTAMAPVGTTLYIYGGGWDWQDEGASVQARTVGVSPDWVRFFREHDATYTYRDRDGDPAKKNAAESYYPYGGFNEYYYAGLDCSGFLGWALYNTLETSSGSKGYVGGSTGFAKRLAEGGLGTYSRKAAYLLPGDIVSISGHVWISLGSCADGSIVILHSTPADSRLGQPGGGVELSAVGGSTSCAAYRLADRYMSEYYPEWYERYAVKLCSPASYLSFKAEAAGLFSWDTSAPGGLADPDGIRAMGAEQILAALFERP